MTAASRAVRTERTHRWTMMWSSLAAVGLIAVPRPAASYSPSDQAAAIVVYPYIAVNTAAGVDTEVRLSNAWPGAMGAHCFYENWNAHCGGVGRICERDTECDPGLRCVPGRSVVDFSIVLTLLQPIAWLASQGLTELPCSTGSCSDQINFGSVPAVPEEPFTGSLRCVAVFDDRPAAADALEGAALVKSLRGSVTQGVDVAQYNAVGMQVAGALDADDTLRLGGPDAEYQPCSNQWLLHHFFEGALEPVTRQRTVETLLTLLPCGADFRNDADIASVVAHFGVSNEFDQRVEVGLRFTGQLVRPLSAISSTVFAVGVQGTLTGQTRIIPVGGGIVAVALERHRAIGNGDDVFSAALNLDGFADPPDADFILLPPSLP